MSNNLEDNFTERKPEGVGKDDIRKTIVAFSNSVPEGRTAVLYIGIRDNGEIQGVSNHDKLQKTINASCEHCYPPIAYRLEVLNTNGKNVIAVVVLRSNNGPHFAGPAYARKGSESIVASEEIFGELIAKRNSKAYEILKWKDKVVTVVRNPMNPKEGEYRIVGCNAHWVTLYKLSSEEQKSYSLKDVELNWDDSKYRLKLIVQ